jgi:signal transduction histidine kinase
VGGLVILLLLNLIIMSSKRHKSELEEAHRQFETIFEASPDGILMLDDQLHVQVANPVLRNWLDKDESELPEKSFFELFQCRCPNLNRCRELSFLLCTSQQFCADLPEVLETELINPPNGTVQTLRLNASRIHQEQNGRKESGFICVLGDISTSKELERIKETYVATLTHDLKTPLLAQQMVLDTLGTAAAITDDQKRLLKGASESVQDLLDMVNATVLFYKLESKHVTLNRRRIQLATSVKEVMSSLQPLTEKKGIQVELEVALDLPDAWVDPLQMKRVFHNLISNATSYGKKNTPIRIRMYTQQGAEDSQPEQLLIDVSNEGKGIAPEDLTRIFDKYYSLSRKFKQIGTGLGLYISRRIVELHGGRIWAESEPGKETHFFVSLPLAQQVEKAPLPDPRKTSVLV